MNLNKTNKTLIICSTFIIGVASIFLNSITPVAIFLTLLFMYLTYSKVISYKFFLVVLITFGFAVFYTDYRKPITDDLAKIVPVKAAMQGRVLSQPKDNAWNKTKFEFEVNSVKTENSAWKPVKAKTHVTIFDNKRKFEEIYIGDLIEITGSVKIPYKATNPGQFDYAQYLKNSGIFTATFVGYKNFKIIEHPGSGKWFLTQKLNKLKNNIISIHRKNLKSPKLEILGGMVFGDYAVPAPKEIKQDFVNTGLLHLLAASGMNVALIFGIWTFIAQRMFIPFALRIVIGMILVAVYALLTGLPPSVTRAAWMLEFILLGKLINRQADTVALLALVCTIMLLIDPLTITDIGFQLSFIVTFGLLVCIPLFVEKLKSIPALISGSILVPIVAQIWVAPIQLFHFNSFATYSVFANILVLPFVGIISFLGFISSLICTIPRVGENLCLLLDKGVEPFITILLKISELISGFPGALHYFASPSIIATVLFYCLILVIVLHIKLDFSKKQLNWIILTLIAALSVITFKGYFSKDLKLLFFDVEEADSILIQTPNRHNILVDTGDVGKKGFNSANTIIIPYLRDTGVKKLDLLVLTHPDKDHIGGTVDILKNIKVDKILDNGEKVNSAIYKNLQDYINKNSVICTHLKNDTEINIDKDIKIKIITPPNIDNSNNDTSLIMYLKYKDFSALLMGDSEANTLNLLKKHIKLPINLIKVGHHGSYNSVNREFIQYLKPELAVISVRENKYFHPSKNTLNILKESKVKTIRTDKDYAIEVKTNGKNIKLHSYNDSK